MENIKTSWGIAQVMKADNSATLVFQMVAPNYGTYSYPTESIMRHDGRLALDRGAEHYISEIEMSKVKSIVRNFFG